MAAPGGWIIRLYDRSGRLLYIATTRESGTGNRLRTLRSSMPWWGMVDPDKTLTDRAKNPRQDMLRAVSEEHPKFYTDLLGNHPFLNVRPRSSDYARRLLAAGPINRINSRHGRH